MTSERSGYIAIVGRPNVGKSTLLNQLIGQKISITTAKPQTTRTQILGVKTVGKIQAVYIDTPGMHATEKHAINRYMNKLASAVIYDANLIIFMMDARGWHKGDELVLNKIVDSTLPVILVLNKVDLIKDKRTLLSLIEKLNLRFHFADIMPLSAKNPTDVGKLQQLIFKKLPEGPHLFADNQITDKDIRFQAAEIIREKLIALTAEEIPYSTNVIIESFQQEKKLISIHAIIWVEREGQKPIVVGKKGERLKKIGMRARADLEKLLKQQVFLRLWVKVKKDWSNNPGILQSLGYE